ncbi:unnamed protein product, partial [Aphanomyces euteiches]
MLEETLGKHNAELKEENEMLKTSHAELERKVKENKEMHGETRSQLFVSKEKCVILEEEIQHKDKLLATTLRDVDSAEARLTKLHKLTLSK